MGGKAFYVCLEGYTRLSGNPNLTCTTSDNLVHSWTGSIMNCGVDSKQKIYSQPLPRLYYLCSCFYWVLSLIAMLLHTVHIVSIVLDKRAFSWACDRKFEMYWQALQWFLVSLSICESISEGGESTSDGANQLVKEVNQLVWRRWVNLWGRQANLWEKRVN